MNRKQRRIRASFERTLAYREEMSRQDSVRAKYYAAVVEAAKSAARK